MTIQSRDANGIDARCVERDRGNQRGIVMSKADWIKRLLESVRGRGYPAARHVESSHVMVEDDMVVLTPMLHVQVNPISGKVIAAVEETLEGKFAFTPVRSVWDVEKVLAGMEAERMAES